MLTTRTNIKTKTMGPNTPAKTDLDERNNELEEETNEFDLPSGQRNTKNDQRNKKKRCHDINDSKPSVVSSDFT